MLRGNPRFIVPIYLALSFFSKVYAADPVPEDPLRYLNIGQHYYHTGEYPESYEYFIKSIETLQALGENYYQPLAESYLWAGAAAFQLKQPDKSETHYKQALEVAEKHGLSAHMANIHTALANLYSSNNRYAEAASHYLKAADIFQELNLSEQSRNSREYGGYMKSLGQDYSGAFAIFDESAKNIELNPDHGRSPNVVAWIYAMRGLSGFYLGNLQASLADYAHASELMSTLEPTREYAQYLGWQGKVNTDLGDYQNAMPLFEKSLEIAKAVDSRDDQILAYAYKGFISAMKKDYESGALNYEKSLEIIRDIGNTTYLIDNLESLAWIYREAGKHQKSLQIYRQLLPLYKNENLLNRSQKTAEAFNQTGLQEYYIKNYQSSIQSFQNSLKNYREINQSGKYSGNIATILFNMGMAYDHSGQSQKAALVIEESIRQLLEGGELGEASESISLLTQIYQKEFGYEKLIELLKKFIPAYSVSGKENELSFYYNFLGVLHFSIARYAEAIDWYKKALEISDEFKLPRNQTVFTHNIGQVNAAMSRFDEALAKYESALAIARENNYKELMAGIKNSTGELYRAWGWYEKSLDYYHDAETIFKENNNSGGLVSVYSNMGQAIRQSGDPLKSIWYYEEARKINANLNDPETSALILSNLGEALRESAKLSGVSESNAAEKYNRALKLYTEALKIDKEIRNIRGINIRRNNIALIYQVRNEHKKAIGYFEDNLAYWHSIGSLRDEATTLTNLGYSWYFLENYDRAADYFEKSIGIHEKLRLTAKGGVRRDYLASQIFVYRNLALTYFRKGELWESLYALELSRAKYLLEQMTDPSVSNMESVVPDFKTFAQYQSRLKKSDAMLSVAQLGEDVFQLIMVTPHNISGAITMPDRQFIDNFIIQNSAQVERVYPDYRERPLDGILTYYRYLLAKPVHSRRDEKDFREIATFLYNLWISPFQKNNQMNDVTSLMIIPDGILGTIPFETLINPQSASAEGSPGEYLIEKYEIIYAQSLTIAEKNLNRKYDARRKPLLAFGGAIYNSDKDPLEISRSRGRIRTGNLAGYRREAEEKINSGVGMRTVYEGLGYKEWTNLPGTLDEVRKISKIIPSVELKTGKSASESFVKSMSHDGLLANYKVLHFATHGIVIPEVPELSAVVLTLSALAAGDKYNNDADDGYLTMREISSLKIRADFVNLSACETGLGKIYEGEGIVGLTQAFMVAGAKSLSVSLWQVSDESTMKFMTGLYDLVYNQNFTFPEAMAKMKRKFIRDKSLSHPFYWAPFVYYGMSP